MRKPEIAAREPIAVRLEKGKTYWWCACGRSREQPFCDGTHKGTGIEPLAFTAKGSGEAWLCQCKRTAAPPWCDGSHARLGETDGPNAAPSPSSAGPTNPIASTPEEPTLNRVHALAERGLGGAHGDLVAMGVPRPCLPSWDDIQILPAQLARRPRPEAAPVDTRLVIGPNARKPLELAMPIFVADMSFGALSREAKLALAKGAVAAGTTTASGEGGLLPEEPDINPRILFEYGTGGFGYGEALLTRIGAFHFKAGQAAKAGIGGHLPAHKVTEEIARVRGLKPGEDAISPPTFPDLRTPADFRRFADRVREISGGIPVGFKLAANHIEADIAFALEAGADYLILDGRGGGTGAAPRLFRDHISVPTLPALARARRFLDDQGRQDVTLIITGGLRLPEDFIKALALGADGMAIASAALQAIGCIAARICHTNRCPTGIATQDPALRARLDVDGAAERLTRFLTAANELMTIMARACGHDRLAAFTREDIATWKRELAELAGIPFSGVAPSRAD